MAILLSKINRCSPVCDLANQCDRGHHPCDQERWNSFLIQVCNDDNDCFVPAERTTTAPASSGKVALMSKKEGCS